MKKIIIRLLYFLPIILGLNLAIMLPIQSQAAKKPSKVEDLTTKSINYRKIKLSWRPVDEAKNYEIYRSEAKTTGYKKVWTTTKLTYTNKKRIAGKKYFYKVRAINGKRKGKFSDVKSGVAKLKGITTIRTRTKSTTQIDVLWKKVAGAHGYRVLKANGKKFKKVADTKALKYSVKSLKVNTTYKFKVRAYTVVGGKKVFAKSSPVVANTTAKKASATALAETMTLSEIRTFMLKQINKERKKKGAAPLKFYNKVNKTAQAKAKDLYKTGDFSHDSVNLGDFTDQYDAAGLSYYAGGENIAFHDPTVKDVMNAWMKSAGHKANILSKTYTHVGIGYYKGYWVQQFIATNETTSEEENSQDGSVSGNTSEEEKTMPCPNCQKPVNVEAFHYYSKDSDGNEYGIYQCGSCYELIEKCPLCKDGYFQAVGITETGTKASKCDGCGHNQKSTCIVNCLSCNSPVLNNSRYVEYLLTFDSTGTFDGEDYIWEYGCYYQEFLVETLVCNSCNSHIIVKGNDMYDEAYENLKENLGTEENIFEHIFWKKQVDSVYVGEENGGHIWRKIYEIVKNPPRIKSLDELKGTEELQ